MEHTLVRGVRVHRADANDQRTLRFENDAVSSSTDIGAGKPSLTVDGTSLRAAPGFVDCQVNGGFGIDLTTEPDKIWELGAKLPQHGVTSFLPTLISGAGPAVKSALATLASRPANYVGAEPLGLHLEGPMLSDQYRGAHPSEHLEPPSGALLDPWSRADRVLMVTLAPELPGAIEAIHQLVDREVVVALGHSAATRDDAIQAAAAGATAVTHLFNCMAPLHHREPNLVGAALTDPRLIVGVIADGVHLDPTILELVWKAAGPSRVALVTDAVAAVGEGEGGFRLGDAPIASADGAVRRLDGTLAGSSLTMIDAVRNLTEFTSATIDEALAAASTVPARLVGASSRGSLTLDSCADAVLLDEHLSVAITFCRGEVAFVAEHHRWRLDSREGTAQWM